MHTPRPHETRADRSAGILLHVTSLPGRFGAGDLGPEAITFLDWLQSGGQKLWQVLPLNPPGFGNSPYNCLSSFAGNPLLISPERLVDDGLLDDLGDVPAFPATHVDYDNVVTWKEATLRRSFHYFERHASAAMLESFDLFEASADQSEWLDDWALFMALKSSHHGREWTAWDRELALREPGALDEIRNEMDGELRFHKYVQFVFMRQWKSIRDAAHQRGIRILGDVPIYTAHDSADVWSHRELFQLDADGHPTAVAGVPPDYFSVTGQRWGNPLYRWDVMLADSFAWWVARVRANLRLVDVLRLDHFRAFSAYWQVSAEEPTAINGRWIPGPGAPFFAALRKALGTLPIIAEDLGFITADVDELRLGAGLPGMKILQFAFDEADSPHLPHRYERDTVVYTGTHDNDTARGWFSTASEEAQSNARAYLGCLVDPIEWAMIRTAYTSVANLAIVPMQDVLGLASEGRMNTPGVSQDNWAWRFESSALQAADAAMLAELVRVTGR